VIGIPILTANAGANSGIGYDSSYTLAAASPNTHVIMGCRSLAKGAQALSEIQARNPAGTLSLLKLDVDSDASIAAAAEKIAADHGVLDVLVNNAGIVVLHPKNRRSELLDTYNTNAASALLLTEALTPLLKKSSDPRVINVSSGLGSMTMRVDETTTWYKTTAEAYRMSKAAMNMAAVCTYAVNREWGLKAWSCCPGFVITNLTGEEGRKTMVENGAESSETSAQLLLEIVEGKRDGEVGLFVKRKGLRWDW